MPPSSTMLLELCDVHGNERHPDRSLLLRAPDYICQIGRGSRSGGQELFPSDTNALFESRVMSREHALLHADPVSKKLWITDLGSMHGTEVNGRGLEPNTREELHNTDHIKLGVDVTRGADTFPALQAIVTFKWVDNESGFRLPETPPNHPVNQIPGKTFSVPEDSECDLEDIYDSDIEYLGQTPMDGSNVVDLLSPSILRSSSVPDSVYSAEDSSTGSEDFHQESTSPLILQNQNETREEALISPCFSATPLSSSHPIVSPCTAHTPGFLYSSSHSIVSPCYSGTSLSSSHPVISPCTAYSPVPHSPPPISPQVANDRHDAHNGFGRLVRDGFGIDWEAENVSPSVFNNRAPSPSDAAMVKQPGVIQNESARLPGIANLISSTDSTMKLPNLHTDIVMHSDRALGESKEIGPVIKIPEPEDMPLIDDDGARPPYSYARMIGMAILRAPERWLTLAQIYEWISTNFAFYRENGTEDWWSSIRSNLSLNRNFIKVERTKADGGKENYWMITPGMEHIFLEDKPGKGHTVVGDAVPLSEQNQDPPTNNPYTSSQNTDAFGSTCVPPAPAESAISNALDVQNPLEAATPHLVELPDSCYQSTSLCPARTPERLASRSVKMKRKRDQISSDDVEDEDTERAISMTSIQVSTSKVEDKKTKEHLAESPLSTVAVQSPEYGAAKRQKILQLQENQETARTLGTRSRGRSVARYAANALTWMAVGAVGTVLALVNLPEDFFA